MMDRQQMLAILSSMGDEALMKAMDANGIQCDSGDYMGEMGDSAPAAEGLESWNQTRIDIPDSKRSPLVDKGKILAAQKKPPQAIQPMRGVLGPQDTGMEEFAPPGEATGAY